MTNEKGIAKRPSESRAPGRGLLIQDLIREIAEGQVVAVVGAGVSIASSRGAHSFDWSLEGPLEVSKRGAQPVEQRVRDRVLELVADDATWPIWIIGFDHS